MSHHIHEVHSCNFSSAFFAIEIENVTQLSNFLARVTANSAKMNHHLKELLKSETIRLFLAHLPQCVLHNFPQWRITKGCNGILEIISIQFFAPFSSIVKLIPVIFQLHLSQPPGP
mmetsp:Transcript_108988/g.199693  ORF Transcript_108988/g.199693 Transcript_108988/m.199693 type:complete len:116 (-) Transcript_108988:387-734(-)